MKIRPQRTGIAKSVITVSKVHLRLLILGVTYARRAD